MGNLKNWCWMHYEQYIMHEYLQCKKEGKLVDDLKPLCEYVANNYGKKDVKALGEAIGKLLVDSEIDKDFSYVEPSTYEEILNELPISTFKGKEYSMEYLKDHLKGAWIGRIAGCLLGKPYEGWRYKNIETLFKATNNYPMNRYLTKKD